MAKLSGKVLEFNPKDMGRFVKTAHKWLSRTFEGKQGVDLQFSTPEAGKLVMRATADQRAIEATLPYQGELLEEPIYLDLALFCNYSFEGDSLKMMKPLKRNSEPSSRRIEVKAMFEAVGCTFKIPMKDALRFNRGWFDSKDPSQRIEMPSGTFKHLQDLWSLPDSFKEQKIQIPVVCLMSNPQGELLAYWYDGRGAFSHVHHQGLFSKLELNATSWIFALQDLAPVQGLVEELTDSLQLRDLDQGYEICLPKSGDLLDVKWRFPQIAAIIPNIPHLMEERKNQVRAGLEFDTAVLQKAIDRALMFTSSNDLKNTSLELAAIGGSYGLSVKSKDTEMRTEETLINPIESPIRIKFTAGALKDYAEKLASGTPSLLEVYGDTAVLSQIQKTQSIRYWMPTNDQ